MRRILCGAAVTAALMTLLGPAGPASAHEGRRVGEHEVVVGWLEEPAFAGFKNAVQFIAEHHADHAPVEAGDFEVEVIFGGRDGEERLGPLPLEAAFDVPGEYHASLIPTRPGTYTFHITGTFGPGEPIDEFFTSGPDTFADIEETAEVEFPVQDPSRGELAELVTRLQDRLDTAQADVEEARSEAASARAESTSVQEDIASAEDAASLARTLAIVAMVLGAGGVLAALVFRRRRAAG